MPQLGPLPRLLLATALAAGSIAAAGCGGDDSEGSSTTTGAAGSGGVGPEGYQDPAAFGDSLELGELRVSNDGLTDLLADDPGARIVGVRVTIENTGDEAVELDFASGATLRNPDGEVLLKVASDSEACAELSGDSPPTLEPGDKLSGCYGFEVSIDTVVTNDLFALDTGESGDIGFWSLQLDL